jgi:flagellin
MALGVLNNLSAIYAENNLNNTNASLQTVLQQLSSGSKINSGADDAAGLSLINGLAANSAALTQSETNATEGVGLLDVADGALSQVTSLLDRAITLATEASNGTLNTTQEGAANQEYTSIMSEINNIGSTTTYNQQQVFTGDTVAIYTGDSSTAGSSVDDLNIRTLSASSMGDTGGLMSYSSGQDNVFIDLSNDNQNAAVTDSLGPATSTTTITVSYMAKGAGGAAASSTATINVGAGTSYANTASGLIDAINNSGLGLNATFATATQAGSAAAAAAAAADHGVGSGADTGIEVSAAGIGTGTNGVGVVGELSLTSGHTLGGTLSIVGSDGVSHNITLGTAESTDTLANLETTINAADYGVTASLNLAQTQMTFTTADPKVIVSGTNLTDIAPAVPSTTVVTGTVLGTLAVNAANDTLSGSLDITEGADTLGASMPLALGTPGAEGVSTDTLAHLMATINGTPAYGITASLNALPIGVLGQPGYQAANTVLTLTKTGTDLGTPTVTGTGVTDTQAANVAAGSTLGSLTVANLADTLTGSLTGVNNLGNDYSIPLGTSGTTDTLAHLMATINTTDASLGITATLSGNTLTFTKTAGDTGTPTVAAGNFGDNASVNFVAGVSPILGTVAVTAAGDILGGTLSGVEDDGHTAYSVPLGNPGTTDTVTNLLTYFNVTHAGWGITASYNAGTLKFTDTGGTGGATMIATPLTDNHSTAVGSGTILDTLTVNAPGDLLSGSLSITSAVTGATAPLPLGSLGTTDTLANLATTITNGGYGLIATTNASAIGTLGQAGYHAIGTVLTITENVADLGSGHVAAVSNAAALGDVVPKAIGLGTNLGVLTVGNSTDTLTGVLNGVKADGVTPWSIALTGQTLATLENTINTTDSSYGITAQLNQAQTILTLTSTNPSGVTQPTFGNDGNITTTLPPDPTAISLADTPTTDQPNSTTLGTLTVLSTDTLSGSLTIGSNIIAIGATDNTAASLVTAINKGNYGVTAAYDANTNTMTFTSVNSSMIVNSGSLDEAVGPGVGAPVGALTPSGVTTSDYYSVGISGTVLDTSTLGGTGNVSLTTDVNGSGGTATTSYSDDAGEALNGTDLSNQADAEAALNDLNVAISDVASQDGYIGAQINTLQSVSQVMTTQQENVVSAQNAIQATDYASATSNMSKYEILSQTGIAALAQANSVQQEVTKLLQ